MLSLKSKHRCQCYSQSASFLYGLRRDAPSTERVLLERLLNILSRAAAHKNKNPQRLWAQSERPEWWNEVTSLTWKNPREHPKDNKDTLRKKIEVLETELRKRNLMTRELEEELIFHRGSKKIDLELKSDFEAIITKASGLHYMLDKIHSKMGQARIISDKIASYISEIKSCVDKIYRRINQMHKQVQEREERKSDFWASMGVSKPQRPTIPEDFTVDSPDQDMDMDSPFLYEDLPERLFLKPVPSPSPTSPSSTCVTLSAEPAELSDLADIHKLYTIENLQPAVSVSDESLFLPAFRTDSPLESTIPPTSGPGSSTRIQRSLSQSDSEQRDLEIENLANLCQGRSASVSFPTLAKRSWKETAESEESGREHLKVKSRRTQSKTVTPSPELILINEEVEEEENYLWTPLAISIASNPTAPASVLETRPLKNRKQTEESETWRQKVVQKHSRSPHVHPKTVSVLGGPRSSTSTTSKAWQPVSTALSDHDRPPSTIMLSSSTVKVDRLKRTEMASVSKDSDYSAPLPLLDTGSKSSPLPSDVVEDAGSDLEDLEILEESSTPTVSMYDPDTSRMDQLAEMTAALSCEDLRPSVTENVMTGFLPLPALPATQSSPLMTRCRIKGQRFLLVGPEKERSLTPVISMVDLEKNKLPMTESTGVGVHRQAFQHLAKSRPQTTVSKPSKEETTEQSLSKAIGGLKDAF